MGEITWGDVLKRDDIVGGELECHENPAVFRGPIKSVKLEGKMVHITMTWTAQMIPSVRSPKPWALISGSMKKKDMISVTANVGAIRPTDIGEGRVSFEIPMLGLYIIFPKGGSQLDLANVRGLKVALRKTRRKK